MTVKAIGAVSFPPVNTKVAKVAARIIFGANHIEKVDMDSIKYFFLNHLSSSYLFFSSLS